MPYQAQYAQMGGPKTAIDDMNISPGVLLTNI